MNRAMSLLAIEILSMEDSLKELIAKHGQKIYHVDMVSKDVRSAYKDKDAGELVDDLHKLVNALNLLTTVPGGRYDFKRKGRGIEIVFDMTEQKKEAVRQEAAAVRKEEKEEAVAPKRRAIRKEEAAEAVAEVAVATKEAAAVAVSIKLYKRAILVECPKEVKDIVKEYNANWNKVLRAWVLPQKRAKDIPPMVRKLKEAGATVKVAQEVVKLVKEAGE